MEETEKTGQKWIAIKDKSLIMLILQSYADPDKKKILDATEHSRMILDIIEVCKLPQTSTYRKINSLIRNGLLVPDGQVSMKYGKNVNTYVTLFKNVEINIVKNDVQVRAKISDISKNAVLRIMREKIIHSKKFSADTGKDLSDAIHRSIQKNGSKSVVPYLLKERIIRV
ncbi:MAG TPA: transcriptional regulator [Candidatus Bathyarchaeia archaeon]|nr:transcriptional regulator [Candidatus Bathyarchaeia archaeon]